MPKSQLVWLKRDLRIEDHAPLFAAAQRGPCIVLYMYETEVIQNDDYAARHLRFINQSLEALSKALAHIGGQLVTRIGEAVSILKDIHASHGIETIWSHEETGNAVTYARDLRVKAWTESVNIPWREFRQFGVIRGLRDRNGWALKWNQMMSTPLTKTVQSLKTPQKLESVGILEPRAFGLSVDNVCTEISGGTQNAMGLLRSFLHQRGERYQSEMSSPLSAESACSRLSAHLAYGTLSMKLTSQALKARRAELRAGGRRPRGDTWKKSLASFDKRLHWHCHFIQKLESQPSLEWSNMATAGDGLRENEFDTERFERWCAGTTGYPMVDACMRYLVQGGWLNFRMRAMLVSFASYHLWLDWRPTSRFLARQFVDYEPGIHYSQMQMQSGTTGINAVRIYSPIKQVTDQDPDGAFIRRWVPELGDVPTCHIAQPHKMSWDEQQRYGCVLEQDYPRPIVNHRAAVAAAKNKIYERRRTTESREESKLVFQKHGSRRTSKRTLRA